MPCSLPSTPTYSGLMQLLLANKSMIVLEHPHLSPHTMCYQSSLSLESNFMLSMSITPLTRLTHTNNNCSLFSHRNLTRRRLQNTSLAAQLCLAGSMSRLPLPSPVAGRRHASRSRTPTAPIPMLQTIQVRTWWQPLLAWMRVPSFPWCLK
jgi:hypothetical protein